MPRHYASMNDYILAYEKWLEYREKNNKAVRKSRELKKTNISSNSTFPKAPKYEYNLRAHSLVKKDGKSLP